MESKKRTITRKLLHAGGWRVVQRFARMLPFGGAFAAAALVGDDIRTKGLVRGVANAGIDAIPFVGLTKNAVELFTGDLIADKADRVAKKRV